MKPFLNKVIKYILSLGIFLALLIVGFAFYSKIPKLENHFVTDADFVNFLYLENINKLSNNDGSQKRPYKIHELKKGTNTVFLIRRFEDPVLGGFDDELYQKITIAIDNSILQPGIIKLPDPKIKTAISDGGSAWPESGCHGNSSEGYIEVLSIDENEINLRTNITFNSDQFDGFDDLKEKCAKEKIDATTVFKKIDLKDLTPYLGSPSLIPYEVTYP